MLSKEQQMIVDAFFKTLVNIIIQARAGAGKTWVLVHILKQLTDPALILAFQRAVRDTIIGRLPADTPHLVSTLNGMGHGLLQQWYDENEVPLDKRAKVNELKYFDLLKAAFPHEDKDRWMDLQKLIQILRANLVDHTDWDNIDREAAAYNIPVDSHDVEIIAGVIDEGNRLVLEGNYDWEDQLYIPCIWNIEALQKYTVVMIDEAQDLTPSKMELARKFLAVNGRVVAAGDRRQAIQGWAGAPWNSFDMIRMGFKCQEFPISESFRFGPKIAKLSHGIVPDLVGASKTSRDEIIYRTNLPWDFPQDSAVIARYNKTLLQAAVDMYKRGKPFRMNRDELGARMKRYVYVLTKQDGFKWEEFEHGVDVFKKGLIERARVGGWRSPGTALEVADCLLIAYQRLEPRNRSEFLSQLEGIFEIKNSSEGPVLITAHSSKGSEFDNVYVVRYQDLAPDPMLFETPADWEAAENLLYVAMSRARETIFLVSEEEFESVVVAQP